MLENYIGAQCDTGGVSPREARAPSRAVGFIIVCMCSCKANKYARMWAAEYSMTRECAQLRERISARLVRLLLLLVLMVSLVLLHDGLGWILTFQLLF